MYKAQSSSWNRQKSLTCCVRVGAAEWAARCPWLLAKVGISRQRGAFFMGFDPSLDALLALSCTRGTWCLFPGPVFYDLTFFQFFFVSVDGRLRALWRVHVHYLFASAVWRANKLSTAKLAHINCLGHTYLLFYGYYLVAVQLCAFPENTVRCWSAFSSTSRMGIELFYRQWW